MTDQLTNWLPVTEEYPIPEDNECTFESPWQARAFALTVALHSNELIAWQEFQTKLATEINADGKRRWGNQTERLYYEQWLDAIEALLIDLELISISELETRAGLFESGERTASEFVEGHLDAETDHVHHS